MMPPYARPGQAYISSALQAPSDVQESLWQECLELDLTLLVQIAEAANELQQEIAKIEQGDPTIGTGNAVPLFLGQSPNYLYHLLDHPRKLAIPYSGKAPFRETPWFNPNSSIRDEKLSKYCTMLLPMLNSAGINNRQNFSKLVIIDFISSGDGLFNFLQVLNHCYLGLEVPPKIKVINLSPTPVEKLPYQQYFDYTNVDLADIIKLAEDEVPRTMPRYPYTAWDQAPAAGLTEGAACILKLTSFHEAYNNYQRACGSLGTNDIGALLKLRDLLLLLSNGSKLELKQSNHISRSLNRVNQFINVPFRLYPTQISNLNALTETTDKGIICSVLRDVFDKIFKHYSMVEQENLIWSVNGLTLYQLLLNSSAAQVNRLLNYWGGQKAFRLNYDDTRVLLTLGYPQNLIIGTVTPPPFVKLDKLGDWIDYTNRNLTSKPLIFQDNGNRQYKIQMVDGPLTGNLTLAPEIMQQKYTEVFVPALVRLFATSTPSQIANLLTSWADDLLFWNDDLVLAFLKQFIIGKTELFNLRPEQVAEYKPLSFELPPGDENYFMILDKDKYIIGVLKLNPHLREVNDTEGDNY